MQAHAHLQVGLCVREGRHAASRIPHELSPKTCQLRKLPEWHHWLTHTPIPFRCRRFEQEVKETRSVLPLNKQLSAQWLKLYSHPTYGIQRTSTHKEPPEFNTLNHTTKKKFKILYLLGTTGESQRRALEHMQKKKKSRHLSDL